MDVHCSFRCSFSSDCHEISFGKWLYLFRLYGFSIKVQGCRFKVSSYRRYLLWRSQKETNLLKAGRRGESKTLAQRLQTSDFSPSPYLHKKRARRLFFISDFSTHATQKGRSRVSPCPPSPVSWRHHGFASARGQTR